MRKKCVNTIVPQHVLYCKRLHHGTNTFSLRLVFFALSCFLRVLEYPLGLFLLSCGCVESGLKFWCTWIQIYDSFGVTVVSDQDILLTVSASLERTTGPTYRIDTAAATAV